ncbi:phosphomannomutase/phosphoglucomutase [Marilutibacter aestuarii]|uniref:phosphomannomutase n=1 Tax=Marilutibacter aestuarii TaxID=1706195 RepID=A0A508AMQ3_9GAMM|nr:phosphomannomutase/phosphoglucomutase [Lysobacter aestuarii]TQD51069.1 phosphomannomutase/phosphoglucomutase [Lysobacter aestuarii]
MVDLKIERPQLSAEQGRFLRLLVAGACVLLAAWFAWSGWQQHRDDSRRAGIEQARDEAVASIASMLKAEYGRMETQLAKPDVRNAVADGDLVNAGVRLAEGWKDVDGARVFAPSLESAYAVLTAKGAQSGGYGRLAALEAAIAQNRPVAWIVGDAGKAHIELAAPVHRDDALVAVAAVRLPIAKINASFQEASLPGATYLALRQGSHSVIERGDTALNNGAESLARKIDGSEWRVAAAVPDAAGGPFGLEALGCFVVALVLLLVAAFASVAHKVRLGRKPVDVDEPEADQTLAEATLAVPVPAVEAAAVAVVDRDAKAPAGDVAIDSGIFRAYDIRGIVGQTLDAGIAELIGHAVGSLMHEQGHEDIVVGRDGRLSGPELTEGLVKGLRKAGRNVIDIGLAPTPLTYFGAYHLRAGSCVSVTGSHNPPDYNGFKIVVGGETLSGDAITDLYARIAEDRLHDAPTLGRVEQRDINDDYIERVSSDVQIERPLRVVVDAGNGVAGELGPRVLEAIGAEVTPLYCEIDGTFPNHHPDPSEPHNLADLIQMVQRLDADLGIAFDGDGDRLGVVTRDGQNIFPDRLLMLFATDVLERNPGAVIIFDVKCTGRLPGHILRHGGSPLMWKTGHSLIKGKMRETDAELAGEMSGHFFFKERWYGFDDGIYAAARLLEILAMHPEGPAQALAELPDGVSTPEIKVDAPDGNPHAFVDRFRENAHFEGARLSTIDGLRVDWPDGWGLVRASNTTPILVMRFDADSKDALKRIQAAFREQLLALKPDLKLPF